MTRMPQIGRALVSFVMLAIGTATASDSKLADKQNMVASNVEAEGLSLRNDIQAAYRQLKESGTLDGAITGNDIAPVVLKHIRIGTDFGSAEQILRSCGLDVRSRPGPAAPGPREDRYDVYATSLSLLESRFAYPNIEVRVSLRPNSAVDYRNVAAVRAWILVRGF